MDPSTRTRSVHPTIFQTEHTKKLRSGTVHGAYGVQIPTLTLQAHEPMELASAAIHSFSVLQWTKLQIKALDNLEAILADWQSIAKASSSGIPPKAFMLTLIAPISDIFFLGGLTKVRFAWLAAKRYTELPYVTRILGTAAFVKGNWSEIVIDTTYWHETYKTDADRQRAIFGALLHECVHAFLATYGCSSYVKKCEDEACNAAHAKHTGYTSHGNSFVKLATSITKVCKERLGADFDLGIKPSMLLEAAEVDRRAKR